MRQKHKQYYLQQWCNWNRLKPAIKFGNLVLARDDRLPPDTWPISRVILCHQGADGPTRVVTLNGSTSTFQRPIVKMCMLPLQIPRIIFAMFTEGSGMFRVEFTARSVAQQQL